MPFQVVIQTEPRSTYVTGEGLLSRVDHTVSFQRRAGPVRPVAHGTHKRTVARVFPLVHGQRVGIFESLVTHGAFIFFGVCVNHLVEAKRVFTLELLPTCRAAERSFFRVHSHVTLELNRRLARLLTELAL